MSLRIWHQSFTVLEDLPAYHVGLRERIAQIVRPGTEVVMHGQIEGTYPSSYPGTDLAYGALYWMHGLQWLAAAREAQKQGFDAMVLASIPSPMIREIRTLVDIPVVGYGETVFHLSGLYGRRAGMIFFNTTRRDFWPEQVRQWGVAERFAGIDEAGVSFDEVVAAYTDGAKLSGVIAKVVEHATRFVQEQSVDVLIAGEMPLNLLLSKARITEIGGATVMDGLATCFKMAETLVERCIGTTSFSEQTAQLSRTLFHLLVPLDLKDAVRQSGNLVLVALPFFFKQFE